MSTALLNALTISHAAPNTTASPLLDPLLLPFVSATNERQAQDHLGNLIHQYADPIIAAAVRRYTLSGSTLSSHSGGDSADLRSETIRLLLVRIAAIRDASARPISDFRAYVKVTARHLCWQHSRKSRREQPFSAFGARDADEESSAFDEITEAVAGVSRPTGVCSLVMQRGALRTIWTEVCTLPRTQRMALLYNFRDRNGASALPLLLLCEITTAAELADALDVPVEELESFLEQLPIEDSELAARLGVSAREVINLRLAARRRLTRRTRAWQESEA